MDALWDAGIWIRLSAVCGMGSAGHVRAALLVRSLWMGPAVDDLKVAYLIDDAVVLPFLAY